MSTSTANETGNGDARSGIAFGRGIDWAIGGVLVVVGGLLALAGYMVNQSIDRQWVSEAIRDGEFRSDVLTEAEAIDVIVVLGEWGTIGLIAVGVLFVIVGVAVVSLHGRARKKGKRTPRWILGVVGAMVGTLLSFVPLSPLIGGAVAGYLDPDESASGLGNGAIAGLLGMLPVVVWSGITGIGVVMNLDGELTGLAAILGAVFLVFTLIYFIGLSALGGYIGGKLR